MAVYDRFKSAAVRIIEKYGAKTQIRIVRDAAPADPDQPWIPQGNVAPVDKDVVIAFLPDKKENRYSQQLGISRMNQTDNMPEGYIVGYMGPVDFAPNLKDLVLRDGRYLTIDRLEEIKPNNESATFYVLRLKK